MLKIPFGALLVSGRGSLIFGDTTLSPTCVDGGDGAGDDEEAVLHDARSLSPNCLVVSSGVKLRHNAIPARILWTVPASEGVFRNPNPNTQSRPHKN